MCNRFALVSTLAVSFAASMFIGCGDNSADPVDASDSVADADLFDAVPNNPPNPVGLGPAPVELGAPGAARRPRPVCLAEALS